MLPEIPSGWKKVLAGEVDKPYYQALEAFLARERAKTSVFPPQEDVFNALKYTPYEQARVLLLGQDPYHDDGQAHGLAFSVRPGVTPPPSLRNIFRELRDDLGCPIPKNGSLTAWAERGVLLLNTVLTVRAHQPASHHNHGWENFTDAVIAALNARQKPLVFILWGNAARKKEALIDLRRHRVVSGPHPSPLSASRGFFGSRPFSKTNALLAELGQPPLDWCLPSGAD